MKKTLLILTTILAFGLTSAQSLSTNEVDEFTGTKQKITKYYIVGSGSFGKLKASFYNFSNSSSVSYAVSMYVATEDFGCSGAMDNYVVFLFKDGTTLKLSKDISDIDCSDYASSLYSLTYKQLNILKTKEVSKIRFSQSDGYADFTANTGTYSIVQQIKAVL